MTYWSNTFLHCTMEVNVNQNCLFTIYFIFFYLCSTEESQSHYISFE